MNKGSERVSVERYAEVSAHIHYFPRSKSAEVIARLGLTGEQWDTAVSEWTDAFAEECALEEETLTRRFGVTFAETKARLTNERSTLSAIGLLPEEKATVAVTPNVSAAEVVAIPARSRPVEIPSYLLDGSLAIHGVVLLEGMRGFTSGEVTQEIETVKVQRAVMPFRTGPGTLSVEASTAEKGRRFVGASAGETANITEFIGEVFPFGSGPPSRQPERHGTVHAETVNLSDSVAEVSGQSSRGLAWLDGTDETQEVNNLALQRPVMPFRAGPSTLTQEPQGPENGRRFLGAAAGGTANITELVAEIFPFRSQPVVEQGGHKGIAHAATVNLSDFAAGMNARREDEPRASGGLASADETQAMNVLAVRRPVMPFRAGPGTLTMEPSTPEKGRGFVGAPAGETANVTEFMGEVFPFGSGLPARQPERHGIPHAGTVNLSDFVAQMNALQEDRPSALNSGQTSRGLSWLDDTDATQMMRTVRRPVTPFPPDPMASSAEPIRQKIRPVFLGAAADETASVTETVAESVPVVERSAPKGAAHAGTANLSGFVAGMTIQREDRPVTSEADQGSAVRKSPTLSLELHAAFCAELALWPARTKATLSNYSLTESERKIVDAYWRERMTADPETAAAWQLANAAAWKVLSGK